MSAKGLAFTGYNFFRYTFADGRQGEYIYRIELLKNPPGHPESRRYLSFMAENDIEVVEIWFRWVYFRRKAENGPFDIFSDIDSQLMHYRRIGMLWLPLACMEMSIGIYNLYEGLDYILGGTSGTAFHLIFSAAFLCIGAMFFFNWNRIRRKIKKLKREKSLRE
jgi:hypothetical protein